MKDLCDTLERLLDKHGLPRVVECLEYACHIRAENARASGPAVATTWDRAGGLVGRIMRASP